MGNKQQQENERQKERMRREQHVQRIMAIENYKNGKISIQEFVEIAMK